MAFFILIFGICPRNVEESVCTGILEFNSRFCERMAEELSDSSPDEPQLPRPVVNGELSLFCRDMLLKHEIERFIVGKCCGYAAFFFFFFLFVFFGKEDQFHLNVYLHGNYWKKFCLIS